jgi:hypothetical protein
MFSKYGKICPLNGPVAEISLENSPPYEMCMHIFVRDKFQQL